MTTAVAVVLIVLTAVAIAWPLFRRPAEELVVADQLDADSERLLREKNVALTAIKEAEFDRATGKLNDDDYLSLRTVYEDRALAAIDALDNMERGPGKTGKRKRSESAGHIEKALFCGRCGHRFDNLDQYCRGCGSPRA